MKISSQERSVLRSLAFQQMELATSPENYTRKKRWQCHRNLMPGKPMVRLEIGGFREEVLLPLLQTITPVAQSLERQLYLNFLNITLFEDDSVVPDYFAIPWHTYFKLFDITVESEYAEQSAGHRFLYPIRDINKEYHTLKPTVFGVDRKKTETYHTIAENIFGDILPVRRKMAGLTATPTQKVIHLMGMEQFLLAMYDCPEIISALMQQVADDYINYFKWLGKEQLLSPTTAEEPLSQGTYCYTKELPNSRPSHSKEVWGYMDSQESVGISPAMYGEFVFPCYQKIAQSFGLLSYGCCEPVDALWDNYLSTLSNLRTLSISAWCNEEVMGERLRNTNVIYQRKPSANYLSASRHLEEDEVRKHIRKTLTAAKGCQLEITQRDILTIHGDVNKAKRYVEIIKSETESHQ